MIEIRQVGTRFEVLSPDRHWEIFEGKLRAHAAALALAAEIASETGIVPKILAPWPLRLDVLIGPQMVDQSSAWTENS